MDATFLFAKSFVNTRFEDLPPKVVDETKKQVLDLIGVAVGGYTRPGPKEMRELIASWGGTPESTMIGSLKKVPAPNAAQANASISHALDFDDVHEAAIIHSGVATIPTALAVAELTGNVGGKEFITAVAIGVDMMCRLGLATTPGKSPIELGWHLTSLYGFMGSAGVAGRVMGLTEEQMINALGIAYHQSGGNGQCVKDGSLMKRLGPGFSVKGGITGAILAKAGVTGARNCLEGEWGFYNVFMRGDYDRNILTKDVGKHFEGENVSIKPYPCCRGIHPAIDATLKLVKEHNIKAADVSKINIFVSDGHYSLLCSPEEVKLKPRSPVDAQFSIPWGVATAMARGKATLDEYTPEGVTSSDILAMTDKITIAVDSGLKRGDKIEPTRVEITAKDGNLFSTVVEYPLGSAESPMSYDDVATKFRGCAVELGASRCDSIIELVSGLDKLGDVTQIMALLGLE